MDDDWDLSVEEMDSLEKEALEKIYQHQNSSSSDNRNPQLLHTTNEGTRILPPTLAPKPNTGHDVQQDQCSVEHGQKVSVKFILHATGNIAVKFAFNPVLVDAVRRIPKATWNAKERFSYYLSYV